MEIRRTIRAEENEIDRVFEYDEVLNIKYMEMLKNGLYKVIFRIVECDIKDSSHPISLESVKKKIVHAASDTYTLAAKVTYSDSSIRKVYACNEYWLAENAKRHGEIDGVTVKEIKKDNSRI